jgi:protein-disulfide isomerase
MRVGAACLSAASLVFVAAAPAAPRKPSAAAVDWTRTVALQPSGGYRMGNPKAKVRLIEFASLTCPHCRTFDQEGASPLIRDYVRTGKVSYEIRNFIRDPFDMGAALISRCNGAKSYFALTRGLLRDQPKWIATAQGASRQQLEAIDGLPPNRMILESARIAGLQRWASAHGVPLAKSRQCLTNAKEIDRLVRMTGGAMEEFPDFRGTPSFVLNGKLLGTTATWSELEPMIREALGERGERG